MQEERPVVSSVMLNLYASFTMKRLLLQKNTTSIIIQNEELEHDGDVIHVHIK